MKAAPRVVWVDSPKGGKRCYARVRNPINSWEFEGVLGLPVKAFFGGRGKQKSSWAIVVVAHMPIRSVTGERVGRYPVHRPTFRARNEVAEAMGQLAQGTYVVVRGRFSSGWRQPPLITEFEVIEDPESRARELGTEAFLDAALG